LREFEIHKTVLFPGKRQKTGKKKAVHGNNGTDGQDKKLNSTWEKMTTETSQRKTTLLRKKRTGESRAKRVNSNKEE